MAILVQKNSKDITHRRNPRWYTCFLDMRPSGSHSRENLILLFCPEPCSRNCWSTRPSPAGLWGKTRQWCPKPLLRWRPKRMIFAMGTISEKQMPVKVVKKIRTNGSMVSPIKLVSLRAESSAVLDSSCGLWFAHEFTFRVTFSNSNGFTVLRALHSSNQAHFAAERMLFLSPEIKQENGLGKRTVTKRGHPRTRRQTLWSQNSTWKTLQTENKKAVTA